MLLRLFSFSMSLCAISYIGCSFMLVLTKDYLQDAKLMLPLTQAITQLRV